MKLPDDTLSEIATYAQAGFYDRDEIIEIFLEELYAPDELNPEMVEAAVDEALTNHKKEQENWPPVTDCDRLKTAFNALNERGVIAMHNAGTTQSDGYSDFLEALDSVPDKSKIVGYCFYHWQDVERAVNGEGLYLAFGPTRSKEEKTRGPEVGELVRTALEQAGLHVDWNGSFDQRIMVPKFDWKHR
ncbi:hypothetical protein OKA05_28215 [Luteolibacter arcticus]|uniref:DUF6891 domain-containing protein n=1 Tax=Luteolibacter arcticus TaxID=1581411 RepID=A0ABT3GSL8_9BACT|nr:hypothetical protein [Luteolibacter arcticus]MCW1926469.1 hypothetical protein [Luteolibacter arcticus]